MEYKTIVVHLDAHPRRMARLDIALRLTAKTGGHLIGLFAIDSLPMPRGGGADWSAAMVESTDERDRATCAETRAAFMEAVARYPEVSTEWREDWSGALQALTLSARYADVAIIGQHDPDSEGATRTGAHFAEDVVLSVPKPLLVVPYVGRFDVLGERVLLAWDSSPQALRAATGALPLLAKAREVLVTVFDAGRNAQAHGDLPGADLTLFLARHGVVATVSQQHSIDGDVGLAMLSRAADLGIDLIVMGAYGHSRARERILGGATRTLFESMTVPVLMSH